MRHRLQRVLANSVLLIVLAQAPALAQDRPPPPQLPPAHTVNPIPEIKKIDIGRFLRPIRLMVVNVNAPAINCVFNAACTVTVNDSVGNIPMPSDVTGTGRLQSRTFTAAAGTPGAGKTAYLYRVDMTQAVSAGEAPCVTDFAIDFGSVARLQYDGGGPADDIFVITQGGLGSIGIFEATKQGNTVSIVFDRPVCAGPTPGSGQTTYFFGLASANAPHAVTAKLGWPGSCRSTSRRARRRTDGRARTSRPRKKPGQAPPDPECLSSRCA